ncbi:unnamed protein product [Gongylonema pulchrum]|uniref:Glyco_tran_10_N domain-containing protein n=1 Tax=Gongylonema pulchrum TaxID=637853 RepID=A0A183DU07_9BILA|nr:unnamed protein product [Gongylonema pulchrum]
MLMRLRPGPLLGVLLLIALPFVWILLNGQRTAPSIQECRLLVPITVDEIEGDKGSPLEKISCTVDNVKTYRCYQDEATDEVYFPFNAFLKKRFDVSGKLIKGPNTLLNHFEWSTSHARVRLPNFTAYDYRGVFGHFASYSVETRDRVRCISAQYGLPMSTQWSPVPYFYPIQIAQYALQHYSRFKTVLPAISLTKGATLKEWKDAAGGHDGIKLLHDEETNATYTKINAAGLFFRIQIHFLRSKLVGHEAVVSSVVFVV